MRLDIRRIGAIKDGENTIGNRTKLRVVKNKVAPPFRVAEFDILYGEGISREGDLLDLGAAHNVVDKSGSWYSYGELRLGQGRENARKFLKDNPDLTTEIDQKIRVALGMVKAAPEAEETPEAPAVAAEPGPRPVKTVPRGRSKETGPVASRPPMR
jgi:recombination protein RecA